MSSGIRPAELGFFVSLGTCGSLGGVARELGISTAAVSTRLSQMSRGWACRW